jgi:hypothetical protein
MVKHFSVKRCVPCHKRVFRVFSIFLNVLGHGLARNPPLYLAGAALAVGEN